MEGNPFLFPPSSFLLPPSSVFAVISTSQPVPVPREPAVQTRCHSTREGNREHPGNPSALGQDGEQLLKGRGACPRGAVGGDQLHGGVERVWRDVRETRANSRGLRRYGLDAAIAIPHLERGNEPRTHAALAVVHERVRRRAPAHTRIAGCCWVRQWIVPSPHTRSTAWMPTTSRSGITSASVFIATRSFRSLNVGTITMPLAM